MRSATGGSLPCWTSAARSGASLKVFGNWAASVMMVGPSSLPMSWAPSGWSGFPVAAAGAAACGGGLGGLGGLRGGGRGGRRSGRLGRLGGLGGGRCGRGRRLLAAGREQAQPGHPDGALEPKREELSPRTVADPRHRVEPPCPQWAGVAGPARPVPAIGHPSSCSTRYPTIWCPSTLRAFAGIRAHDAPASCGPCPIFVRRSDETEAGSWTFRCRSRSRC